MPAIAQDYWDLIRGAKRWLAVTLGLFFFGAAVAIVLGFSQPSVIQRVIQVLEDLPRGPEIGFPGFIHFFKHNLTVMLITWCGSLVLAIPPVLDTLVMGFILGVALVDNSLAFCFLAICPHGIMELPAIFISNAFFLRLGLRWAFQEDATARKRAFVTDFRGSIKIALLCAVLICGAAVLEAFATPKFLAAYAKAHFAGIGVHLVIKERTLTISDVLPDGPAAKAGLSSGLLIQRIDGFATTGRSLKQCRDMLHGGVGTRVRLEMIDTAQSKTNTVELVRELRRDLAQPIAPASTVR
jgi:uncharacterized membrane protein SpoIIM required for sporulation